MASDRSAEERFVEAMRDLLWDSHAVCTGEHPHNVHGCESDVYDAVHAFADAVCAGRARYGMFAEGGEAACRVRASQRLNGDILDGRRNPGDPLDFESEQEKEHATCRANLLKRVMGGE